MYEAKCTTVCILIKLPHKTKILHLVLDTTTPGDNNLVFCDKSFSSRQFIMKYIYHIDQPELRRGVGQHGDEGCGAAVDPLRRPPFSQTVTPRPSPASSTCECTATWSCRRRRSVWTTSPNASTPPFASWHHLGRRLGSHLEAMV